MAPKPPCPSMTVQQPDRRKSCRSEDAAPAGCRHVAAGGNACADPGADDDECDDDEDDLNPTTTMRTTDLVVFTAREAAGALATMSRFMRPYLGNYRRCWPFVGFGVLVETLFNVIMPLSLKYLIDDAFGEEDFGRST